MKTIKYISTPEGRKKIFKQSLKKAKERLLKITFLEKDLEEEKKQCFEQIEYWESMLK